MERRTFLAGTGAVLLGTPLAAEAQQARKVPVVGILVTGTSQSTTAKNVREGLRDLGYIEGRTIVFDLRAAGGTYETLPGLATDLVQRKVDVLLAIGPAAIRAARDATSTIPIVALDLESDPVKAGFARTFAQPGGNLTGCFLDHPGLTGKWLELIREVAPGARRVAILMDPTTGPWQLAAIKEVAERIRMELHILEIRQVGDLDHALEAGVKGGSRALVQLSSPLFDLNPTTKQIADFAVKHRLPAISMFRRFPDRGGLMSYGPNQPEYQRRLSSYADKILKGAKPGDLPIEEPTKFELVINLKTAKALGLTIPPSLRARADDVIQ